MVNLLKLIRWPNLLIIVLVLVVSKYWVFHSYLENVALTFSSAFSDFQFFLLVTSILLITIGGYIINDIEDVSSDSINKPEKNVFENELSIDTGIKLYYFTTLSGILIGLLIGWQLENIQLAMPHLLASGLLWVYAKNFSKSLIIGNIIVALLSALVPITYLLLESNTFIIKNIIGLRTYYENAYQEGPLALLIFWNVLMAIFAFTISLSREILKDVQDMKGDKRIGGKSIAIEFGEKTAFWIALIPLIVNIPLAILTVNRLPYYESLKSTLFFYIFSLAIFVPVILIIQYLRKGLNPDLFSKILKLYMLLGILSSIVILWMI
jgi:4-hydroxybenzoate polyprenyltransferase